MQNLDQIVNYAVDQMFIDPQDAPRFRRLISKRGWTKEIIAGNLDIYAIAADYM